MWDDHQSVAFSFCRVCATMVRVLSKCNCSWNKLSLSISPLELKHLRQIMKGSCFCQSKANRFKK